jgi:hypothetical protein
MSDEATKLHRILDYFRNHKWFAFILAGGILVIGLGGFFDAISKIEAWLSHVSPDRGTLVVEMLSERHQTGSEFKVDLLLHNTTKGDLVVKEVTLELQAIQARQRYRAEVPTTEEQIVLTASTAKYSLLKRRLLVGVSGVHNVISRIVTSDIAQCSFIVRIKTSSVGSDEEDELIVSDLTYRYELPRDTLADIYSEAPAFTILFLGDGKGDLPGVRNEFRAIVDRLFWLISEGHLLVNFLVGTSLTRQNLEARIKQTNYTIIYYAGHTRESGSVLSFAEGDLPTRDFLKIVGQNTPVVLVMNACNSLGRPHELELMGPLLFESDAILAIGTSYVVRDDMPSKVFPFFFDSLFRGRTFGDAFLEARSKDPSGLPQYFLLGDPAGRIRPGVFRR